MLYWICKIIAYIPFWLIFPAIVKGRRNLPKGKCIYIVNHRSNIDPLLVLNMFWRKQYTLSKQEIFRNKIFAKFLKLMNAIPVNREKVDISTIKKCLTVLKDENVLIIFPEGTRNKTSEILSEFKGGAGIFAIKSEAPIIPIWIKEKPKLFMLNKLYVGEPFYLTKEQSSQSDEIMRNKMLELHKSTIRKK